MLRLFGEFIWYCFLHEQEAETRVKRMEDEMLKLGKELNKKVEQIHASDVATEKVRIAFTTFLDCPVSLLCLVLLEQIDLL